MLHVECQGYRDPQFAVRLFRYHLTLTLRYFPRPVHTVAVWLVRPPAPQRVDVIEHGGVTVRVRSIVLSEADARALLADPRTACFAAGARADGMTSAELCAEVARVLAEHDASWRQRHMAAIAAARAGRYKEMVRAMEHRGLGPVIIEDLVDFGHEQGLEQGLEQGIEQGLQIARGSVLDVFAHRGFVVSAEQRARVEEERSLERLRSWLRRGLVAASADDVLAEAAEG